MEVYFESLTCTSPLSSLPGGKRKILLDNVSGRFLPGELTGILGPSGAGKTTLLDAISGYRRSGVEGRISAGNRRSRRYISQEDLLPSLITAGELMEFASCLKLPSSYTAKQRASEVEDVLTSLGLNDIVNTRTEGLSGGQRRRLVIALELISHPQILFLDEPTSGLDTVSCGQLIRLLSNLSRGGRTIVCTIHQPSASLFDIFDKVYFLAAGRCVYQGGPGPHLLRFLEGQGLHCPIHHNPADFIIEVTEEKSNIDILVKATDNGRFSWYIEDANFAKGNNKDVTQVDRALALEPLEYKECGEQSFWVQFTTIFFRILLQARRNKTDMRLQLLHHAGCSVLLGSMSFQIGKDATDLFILLKFCIGVVLFHAFTMQMVPALYFPFEVKLLKKEHFNKWYGLLPYFLAFTAAKSPTMIPLNLFYSTVVYTLAGWPLEVERFAFFCLIGLMTALVAESIGLTVGALFSAIHGAAIGPLMVAPFLGLSCYGFDFMRNLPPFMDFLVQTSYMRTGLHSMILVLFGLDRPRLECSPDADFCPYTNPKHALHILNLDRFTIAQTLCHLAISLAIFRLTFYLALKWKLRR